jgi:hypothetical protein
MVAADLRFEDKLYYASSFVPWKARFTVVLMKNELWEFVD